MSFRVRTLAVMLLGGLVLAPTAALAAEPPGEGEPPRESRGPSRTRRPRTPGNVPPPPAVQPPAAQAPTPQPPARNVAPRVSLDIGVEHELWGTVVIELEPRKTRMSVQNFLHYVDTGFYNGVLIHRVLPGFIIQTGGYMPGMVKKDSGLRPAIRNESRSGLRNVRGTVAVARAKAPNSGASQFFFNLADNPGLDWDHPEGDQSGYCAFGRVVDGIAVLERIASQPLQPNPQLPSESSMPVQAVIIRRAYRTQAAGLSEQERGKQPARANYPHRTHPSKPDQEAPPMERPEHLPPPDAPPGEQPPVPQPPTPEPVPSPEPIPLPEPVPPPAPEEPAPEEPRDDPDKERIDQDSGGRERQGAQQARTLPRRFQRIVR